MADPVTVPTSGPQSWRGLKLAAGDRVSRERHYALSAALFEEIRLLADEDYDAWLQCLDPAVHYWMPGIADRYRKDKRGPSDLSEMAFFDDDLRSLKIRIARLQSGAAWPEDPPTRHVLSATNVEAFETELPDHFVVMCVVTSFRSRGDRDAATLYARRRDVWRQTPEGLRLVQRHICLAHSLLMSKNLNVFL